MKKSRITTIIYLIIWATFMPGCQSDLVNNNGSELLINEPVSEISQDETTTPFPANILPVEATPSHIQGLMQTPTGEIHSDSEPNSIPTTISNQVVFTHTFQHYTIVLIEKLNSPLWHIQWSDDGHWLTYGIGNSSSPIYQSWWLYDIKSGDKTPLPPPQTNVNNITRESLGVCSVPLPNAPYACSPYLYESPAGEQILFASNTIETQNHLWLAYQDGSHLIPLHGLKDFPQEVIWSGNEVWLLVGFYWGTDSSSAYFLVAADGTFIEDLGVLTSSSHFRVQGPKPQFSPDGQKLAFVATQEVCPRLPCAALDEEDNYHLYILDLVTMESQMVSQRFGLFQWAADGTGLYVLDGAANTAGNSVSYILRNEPRLADFYYIDLTQTGYPEHQLANGIPVYLPYTGAWAYSPEAQAMAGTFGLDDLGRVFSILFFEP
jgi:hypothetical protein